MNNKVIFGGLAAGVAFFLLGWLLYGTLLVDIFASHAGSAAGVMKEGMPDFIWLIIGNLSMGLFLALACSWAGASQASSGALVGFWVGLLVGIGIDGVLLGTTNLMTPMGMVIDVLAFTVMCVVSGAIAGLVIGMSGRTVTA